LTQARNTNRRPDAAPASEGPSLRQLAGAAAASSGGATGALAGAANSAGGGAAGAADKVGQSIGTGLIKGCWEALAPTFGLTILVLDLMFLLGAFSSFFRKYIPEVGHEWIPEQARKLLPKSALLPLKYAELTALFLITGLVLAVLTLLFAMTVYLLSILMAVAQGLTG
jgi:hypothetical protein